MKKKQGVKTQMYVNISRRLLLSLGLGCMTLVPQQATAQAKVGVVNFNKALDGYGGNQESRSRHEPDV